MTQIEIESELARLNRQLNSYKSKKQKTENEMREIEYIIEKIRIKTHEIEDGLQETLNNIEKKLKLINQRSRFRIRHLDNAKSILLNSTSSNALQSMRDSEKKATDKYWTLDNKLSGYCVKISELESEINVLKQQLI